MKTHKTLLPVAFFVTLAGAAGLISGTATVKQDLPDIIDDDRPSINEASVTDVPKTLQKAFVCASRIIASTNIPDGKTSSFVIGENPYGYTEGKFHISKSRTAFIKAKGNSILLNYNTDQEKELKGYMQHRISVTFSGNPNSNEITMSVYHFGDYETIPGTEADHPYDSVTPNLVFRDVTFTLDLEKQTIKDISEPPVTGKGEAKGRPLSYANGIWVDKTASENKASFEVCMTDRKADPTSSAVNTPPYVTGEPLSKLNY